MGMLANAFGFTTSQNAAASSLGYGGAGVGLEAAGNIFQGIGGYQQAAYSAALARTNAGIQYQNAAAALGAGRYEEQVSMLRTGETIGAQRAAQGANNIDVNIGSTKAVRGSTAEIGAMDAALIHYNAAREAYGLETEARSQTAQAKLDQMAGVGALAGGFAKAAGGLLAGASSLGQKYATFQYLGANSSSATPGTANSTPQFAGP